MADWHQGMRRAELIAHGDELNAEIDRLARENAALRAEVTELREAVRATAARLDENGMTGTRTARALLARVDSSALEKASGSLRCPDEDADG